MNEMEKICLQEKNRQSDGSKTETTLSSVDTRGSWPITNRLYISLWASSPKKTQLYTSLEEPAPTVLDHTLMFTT